jgi:uncharacterized membrane protein
MAEDIKNEAIGNEKDDAEINANKLDSNSWKGLGIIFIGVIISLIIFVYPYNVPLVKIGLIGLVTFFSVLFGTYFITKNWYFDDGEFRKAITVSVIAVFFATMAFSNSININQSSLIKPLFDNYWAIVTTVIAFYFGSRVLDNKIKKT